MPGGWDGEGRPTGCHGPAAIRPDMVPVGLGVLGASLWAGGIQRVGGMLGGGVGHVSPVLNSSSLQRGDPAGGRFGSSEKSPFLPASLLFLFPFPLLFPFPFSPFPFPFLFPFPFPFPFSLSHFLFLSPFLLHFPSSISISLFLFPFPFFLFPFPSSIFPSPFPFSLSLFPFPFPISISLFPFSFPVPFFFPLCFYPFPFSFPPPLFLFPLPFFLSFSLSFFPVPFPISIFLFPSSFPFPFPFSHPFPPLSIALQTAGTTPVLWSCAETTGTSEICNVRTFQCPKSKDFSSILYIYIHTRTHLCVCGFTLCSITFPAPELGWDSRRCRNGIAQHFCV